MVREAEKLAIAHQRAALQPQVTRDHHLHLVESSSWGTRHHSTREYPKTTSKA